MYAPVLQSTSSDASGAQCVIALVVWGIVVMVLLVLASRTRGASPYARTVKTSCSREQVVKLVEGAFPKSIASGEFNWKPAWPESDRLTLSGYYLTNGQGCLVLFLTGLLPGYFLIRYLMGRTEEVAVDFSKFDGSGELTLGATGLRAQREVDRLAGRLGASV